jgi:type III pantothenate kinase
MGLKMLLAIDAGNTNITFAVFDGSKTKAMFRIKTDAARTADEYAAFVFQSLTLKKCKLSDIKAVIISSVVPDANFQLRLFCHQTFSIKPLFIGKDIKKLPVVVDVDRPSEVGSDRLLNAVAVLEYYKAPAIVVDFGTATNFDVIDKAGAFVGGVICPGINLSINALHQAAAKLPKVSISRPEKSIGRDTVSAMQSGIFYGYVSLVEGMIERIMAEMKSKPIVIATGGLAPLFKESIPAIDYVDDDLTLKGLLAIYKSYQKQNRTKKKSKA